MGCCLGKCTPDLCISLYITNTVMNVLFIIFCFPFITEQLTFRRFTVLAASGNKHSIFWDIVWAPATIHRAHSGHSKQRPVDGYMGT